MALLFYVKTNVFLVINFSFTMVHNIIFLQEITCTVVKSVKSKFVLLLLFYTYSAIVPLCLIII